MNLNHGHCVKKKTVNENKNYIGLHQKKNVTNK